MAVQQSGRITRGHVAKFIADGVIADGGPIPSAQRVLASLSVANFNTDNDQALILPEEVDAFQLTGLIIARATVPLTNSVGGFYPEAGKVGSPIVAASQVYSVLTSPTLLMNATLTSFATSAYFTRSTLPDWAIYFSLVTPEGSVAEARIFATGFDLTI